MDDVDDDEDEDEDEDEDDDEGGADFLAVELELASSLGSALVPLVVALDCEGTFRVC